MFFETDAGSFVQIEERENGIEFAVLTGFHPHDLRWQDVDKFIVILQAMQREHKQRQETIRDRIAQTELHEQKGETHEFNNNGKSKP